MSLGRLRAMQHWEVSYGVGISMHLNSKSDRACLYYDILHFEITFLGWELAICADFSDW